MEFLLDSYSVAFSSAKPGHASPENVVFTSLFQEEVQFPAKPREEEDMDRLEKKREGRRGGEGWEFGEEREVRGRGGEGKEMRIWRMILTGWIIKGRSRRSRWERRRRMRRGEREENLEEDMERPVYFGEKGGR